MTEEFKETIKKLKGLQLMTLRSEIETQLYEIQLEMYRRVRNE